MTHSHQYRVTLQHSKRCLDTNSSNNSQVHSVSWVRSSLTAMTAAAADPMHSMRCGCAVQRTVDLLNVCQSLYVFLQQRHLACNHWLPTGLNHLKSHEGGKAVRCAGEATSLCQAAVKAAAAFDKAAPASQHVDHAQFDVCFGDCSSSVYTKVRGSRLQLEHSKSGLFGAD